MTTQGRVGIWNSSDGWGVIESDLTPGGCWMHVSMVRTSVERLGAGTEVAFTYEAVGQDGYEFRAIDVIGPGETRRASESTAPSPAYHSELVLGFDQLGDE